MNTYKKVVAGLLLTAVFVVMAMVLWPGNALAFVQSEAAIKNASFRFKNRATIIGTFNGQEITFTDSNSFDTGPFDANYKPPDGAFCRSGGSVEGITLVPNPFDGNNRRATITAVVDLDWTPDVQASCDDTSPNELPRTIANPSAAYLVYEWDEQDLLDLIGKTGNLSDTPNPNLLVKDPNDNCGGGAVVILNSGSTTQGTMYVIDINGSPGPPPFSGCPFKSWPVSISGTRGEPATGEEGTGTTGEDAPSCEKNFSSVFAYFLCPALDLADSAAGALFGFVEDQPCFNTGGSQTGGVECGGDVILTDQVKASWNAFRVIATALLIVIMLVMVVAQAFSVGPFDAYTVRKLLPKILAAVILIQLSWVMLKFFIDLSNDIGSGIAELMFAPFGGIDSMRLDDLVGKEIGEGTGTTTNADVFAFFAVIAAVAVGIANLPGLFALAFFAVVSLFLAFAVLIVRKLLIILLVLTAPLALIAWILPAADSYWKTWKDNFTKLLLMFPMIMAMIAAGRIMAFVASQSAIMFPPRLAVAHLGPLPVPYFAAVDDFIGLAIIVIAFFVPYLLILKTFSWAGSLMRVVASGATNSKFMRNIQEKGGEAVGGYTERQITGRFAKKYSPTQGWGRRTAYSALGGRLIPTKHRQALLTQRGDKWAEQRNAEAGSYVARGYEKALGGYNKISRDKDGNYLDKDKEIVKDRSQAHVEQLTGVAAGKQFLVDTTGLEGSDVNNRSAYAAHKMLIDTHSEIEMQNARIQGGRHDGKRVTEVSSYRDTLENSPQHYSEMTRRRPDFAPDVIEKAQEDVNYSYDQAYAETDSSQRAAKVRALDRERVSVAIERMSPEALASAHYGLFEDIAKVGGDKIKVMDPVSKKETETTVSGYFAATLDKFQQQGGVVGQNSVGSLRGGKEKYVVAALNAGKAPEAPTITLDDIQSREGLAARVQQRTQQASAAPAREAAQPAAGEVRIPHALGEMPDEVTSRPEEPPPAPPSA